MQVWEWLRSIGWRGVGMAAFVLSVAVVAIVNARIEIAEKDLAKSVREYWNLCTSYYFEDDEKHEAVHRLCDQYRDSVIEDHGAGHFLEGLYSFDPDYGPMTAEDEATHLWAEELEKELTNGKSRKEEYWLLLKRYEALHNKDLAEGKVKQAEDELREFWRERNAQEEQD